ncbi:MAG: hypothetical protein R2939_07675 [Kofleriaceae bacterium]
MSKQRAATSPGVYSDLEEAFFAAGSSPEPTEQVERFEDLDEGYQPVGFWRRLLGGKR